MQILMFALLFISYLICMLEAKPGFNTAKMPNGCEIEKYCYEKGDSYPQKDIDRIVTGLHIKAGDKQTENRDGSPGEDEEEKEDQPCLSMEPKIDPIYFIRDTNNEVRYVVQNENFKQLIREVKCRNPGRMQPARTPFQTFDVCMYNVTCVEELVPVKFLVLTHDRSNVEVATIEGGLPMACSCKYSFPTVGDVDTCQKEADTADDKDLVEAEALMLKVMNDS